MKKAKIADYAIAGGLSSDPPMLGRFVIVPDNYPDAVKVFTTVAGCFAVKKDWSGKERFRVWPRKAGHQAWLAYEKNKDGGIK